MGTLNILWADGLLNGMAAAGVRHAVISPGSRSTPLVLACGRHPEITLHTQIDERCAAFFALGLARSQHQPVALIATSGSAPAHWYPAVIEASHSCIPLLLLSADRPPELHARKANQTIDQTHLFGRHVRAFHDAGAPHISDNVTALMQSFGIQAVHEACWPQPGPVHINLPFREPLFPDRLPTLAPPAVTSAPVFTRIAPDRAQTERIGQQLSCGQGVIICGFGRYGETFAQHVTTLASKLGAPILADPLSGLRFGPHDKTHIFTGYDAFLRRSGTRPPRWALQFGNPAISKALQQYLSLHETPIILNTPYADWPDPLHQSKEAIRCDPAELCQALNGQPLKAAPDEWMAQFRKLQDSADATWPVRTEKQPFEAWIIQDLIETLPERATLFSGNSQPIRQLDSWSGSGNKQLRIVANRGASGIDGNVSTLLGMAATSNEPVVGLIGDLALYHDMNGLLAAKGLNAVIIVLNNGGGGIFGHLPQAGLDGFEDHWLTPSRLDLSQVARLYNLAYRRIDTTSDFRPALNAAIAESGVNLIEVVIDRKASLEQHKNYWKQQTHPEYSHEL